MTTMTDTLNKLVETTENGKRGFAEGAEKLSKDGHVAMAATFAELSLQRATFASELRALDPALVDAQESDGSVAGVIHRSWMALKDALNGNDPHGVLDAAEQGEDHAVKEFSAALEGGLPDAARPVVARQYAAIKASHDKIKALRDQD